MSHGRVPQPFSYDDPIDYGDAQQALSTLNRRRVDARNELQKAGVEVCDAERDYRKLRATKHGEATGTVDAKKVFVDAETADARHRRDMAEWSVKIMQEKLAELDGQRASLHRLCEWSMRVDPNATLAAADSGRQTFRAPVDRMGVGN